MWNKKWNEVKLLKKLYCKIVKIIKWDYDFLLGHCNAKNQNNVK